MFTLLANFAPQLHPDPNSPASVWVIWGVCVGLVAVFSGRAIRRSRLSLDKRVGVALLFAVALAVCSALLAVWESHKRQAGQNQQDREQLGSLTPSAEPQSNILSE